MHHHSHGIVKDVFPLIVIGAYYCRHTVPMTILSETCAFGNSFQFIFPCTRPNGISTYLRKSSAVDIYVSLNNDIGTRNTL